MTTIVAPIPVTATVPPPVPVLASAIVALAPPLQQPAVAAALIQLLPTLAVINQAIGVPLTLAAAAYVPQTYPKWVYKTSITSRGSQNPALSYIVYDAAGEAAANAAGYT